MKPVETVLARVNNSRKQGAGWMACCPAHEDKTPSLSITEGEDGKVLLKCFAGCSVESVVTSMGLKMSDLMGQDTKQVSNQKRRIKGAYDYQNEAGKLLFQVVRYEPKTFRQRRPNGSWGWIYDVQGVRVVPYHLPELLANRQEVVFIVEGEKDVHTLESIGCVATCNAGGALKWTNDHAIHLKERDVVILPDNDDKGRQHAEQVAHSLQGIARAVKVVSLPDLPQKGDVSDWFAAGGTKEELQQLVIDSPKLENAAPPKSESPMPAPSPPKTESFRPFPIEVVPEIARDFVFAASKALGCDAAYIALPLLAVLASAIGNARRIRLKHSWREPCIIWAVVVGESGTLKSPAFDLAVGPLKKRQAIAYQEYQDRLHRHEQDLQLYQADFDEWKRKGRKNSEPPPDKPEPPQWQQIVAEDTTVEALADLLDCQPLGLLLARDELSGWLASFDAYKASKGADVAHWLSMHRGGELLVNRKGGKKLVRVASASVSICGGIQPARLADSLGSEHFENGLAARLLLAMPPRTPKQWTEDDLTDSDRAPLEQLLDKLLQLPMPEDEQGERQPVDLPLTSDAKRRWIAFYNAHNQEQNDLSGELAAAWSKLEGYAARLALLFELVHNPDNKAVGIDSIEAGITLARWFADEAVRIYAGLGGGGDTSAAKEKREVGRVADWIRARGGEATARDVQRNLSNYRTSDEAENVLDRLAKAGQGKWKVRQTGGRPARVFCLVDTTDTDTTPKNVEENELMSSVGQQ